MRAILNIANGLVLRLGLGLGLALGLMVLALPGDAKDQPAYKPLTHDEYLELLPGKTIKGEYRFMRQRTKTYQFQETHNADGTTDYKEGPIRSKGIWYPLGKQKICYKYPGDPNMSGTSCWFVYNDDGCFYGYNISQMTLKGPRYFDNWGARWVIVGSGGTCDASVS